MSGKGINVKHVAKLANLAISPEEEKKFEEQLSQILEYVSQLQSVDTTGVVPTSQVIGLLNKTRPDEIVPGLKLDADYFKVKAIFDHE
jgi:aspartyl-tRNA(Asn)/glutamyl-tRNA(Gln) amidotransferase subunit C